MVSLHVQYVAWRAHMVQLLVLPQTCILSNPSVANTHATRWFAECYIERTARIVLSPGALLANVISRTVQHSPSVNLASRACAQVTGAPPKLHDLAVAHRAPAYMP